MAASIPSDTDNDFLNYLKKPINTKFTFQLIDETCIKNIIEQLHTKSSSGYDEISTKLLKLIKPTILKPLTLIINQSLTTGIFPDKLKIAKITPVYKKENIHYIENYRPISIMPSISKVLERVVYDQLYTYFTTHHYLSENQYGFRKLHSTELATLELTDRINLELDKGNSPLAIFLDMSKAFDTLNHNILVSKLNYYGIKNASLNWFRTYLKNRLQFVQIDQQKSKTMSISLGVPQGTILGPLLFLIYINDIQYSSKLFNFIKYADDTTLFNPMADPNQRNSTIINTELKNVSKWLKINRLSLNTTKTKYMIFHHRQKSIIPFTNDIKLDNVTIEKVEKYNFLGFSLDEHMNWNNHIDKIAMKVSRTIGILCKLKHIFPFSILQTLYSSLIIPHLTNGILIWGYNLEGLFKLQKKAIRIIANRKYNDHTEPIFKSPNLLKLHDIFKLSVLKFYYNYCNDLLPKYFKNQFHLVHRYSFYAYNIRSRNLLHTTKIQTKTAEKSLRYILPKLINETIPLILNKIYTHSLYGYTNYIKQYFLSNYSYVCTIDFCYICNRE